MFSIFKKNDAATNPIGLTVLFHKECNGHIEHGTIYATNRQLGVNNESVRFGFAEVAEAPLMSPEILAHVWDQAERQGYIVHSLRSYSTVFTHMPPPVLHSAAGHRNPNRTPAASTARKRADQPNRESGAAVTN